MDTLNVYWGDFHKHLDDADNADAIIQDASFNLDFYPVLCYPFVSYDTNGLMTESVQQRPEFLERWAKLQQAVKTHNTPGNFVTFLGYEWHGNRSRWGDHNVIYFDENNPLDDTWELADLYSNLRERKALAIPHHTGYYPGWRGKDWSVFDENLSPIMEIYSAHGCSEGIDSPVNLGTNQSMGPRTSGGTLVDALNRGLHVGVIASNDGAGLPGSWNLGVAGVWAEELTRESLWNALKSRRTYGVTGDRIKLLFSINGQPMGSVLNNEDQLKAKVRVSCAQPLDRIELIHNGVVIDTYCHRGTWEKNTCGKDSYKVLLECGWGPNTSYGFKDIETKWEGEISIDDGTLESVQPRFSCLGQSYKMNAPNSCNFNFKTSRKSSLSAIQGLILEIQGDLDTTINAQIEGNHIKTALKELQNNILFTPLLEESKERISEVFNVNYEDFKNPDRFYHNARKIRINPAYPNQSYSIEKSFDDLPVESGGNYYYVRVSQVDGQMAWSSPVWVK